MLLLETFSHRLFSWKTLMFHYDPNFAISKKRLQITGFPKTFAIFLEQLFWIISATTKFCEIKYLEPYSKPYVNNGTGRAKAKSLTQQYLFLMLWIFSSISVRFFINLQDLIKFHESNPTAMADNMPAI